MRTWDPQHYLHFAGERSRPFDELLARLPADLAPAEVVDLGCGPGHLTAALAARWPAARVRGLDSSPEMVERARRDVPQLEFAESDLASWAGGGDGGDPVDVAVAHAVLQWVPGHLDLLPAIVDRIRAGGWLALQVPGNFDEPSHTLRRDLAAEAPYADLTRDVATPAAHDAATYLRALAALGCRVDAWETTYLHVLTGEDPVFAWVSGTGARPTLQALPETLRSAFEAEFKTRLRDAYPPIRYAGTEAVLLPFRRVFVVAQVPG